MTVSPSQKQGGWTPLMATCAAQDGVFVIIETDSRKAIGKVVGTRELADKMCAAPELYEALEEALENFGPLLNDTPADRKVAAKMRAALSRANPSTDQGEG